MSFFSGKTNKDTTYNYSVANSLMNWWCSVETGHKIKWNKVTNKKKRNKSKERDKRKFAENWKKEETEKNMEKMTGQIC